MVATSDCTPPEVHLQMMCCRCPYGCHLSTCSGVSQEVASTHSLVVAQASGRHGIRVPCGWCLLLESGNMAKDGVSMVQDNVGYGQRTSHWNYLIPDELTDQPIHPPTNHKHKMSNSNHLHGGLTTYCPDHELTLCEQSSGLSHYHH